MPERLTPRLAALAEAVPEGSRVADVGSDHGRLPLWLVETGRAVSCVATEASEALLARVERPPAEASWADRVVYRCGDGLAALSPADRIDTIVLAGLGGRAIADLLAVPASDDPSLLRLVLQPRSDEAVLRAWLSGHHWRLVSESLTLERRRLHLTLAAERGDDGDLYRHPALTRDDLLAAGPLLVRARPPSLIRLWQEHRRRLAAFGSASARDRLARAERVLAAISRPAG